VGQAILPAAAFQAAGPAGKRVRSQDWLPHNQLQSPARCNFLILRFIRSRFSTLMWVMYSFP